MKMHNFDTLNAASAYDLWLMSAQRSDYTAVTNKMQHDALCAYLDDLAGVTYVEGRGKWNDEREDIVVVFVHKDAPQGVFDELHRLAFDVYQQESVLVVLRDRYNKIHPRRKCYFFSTHGTAFAGTLRAAAGPVHGDYTEINGVYYQCVK